MMKINHVAIYVKDLQNTKAFFEKYFAAQSGELYHNPKTDFSSYFLSFEDGAKVEIMNLPSLSVLQTKRPLVGYAHLAFGVGSKENVDSITEALRRDGFRVISGPRTTGDGCYESTVSAVEDILLEITV